ncbi:MAG: hypothetical protein Q7T61_09370 [Caulobacter sp.]|nr:hypothetical protein [Caulobacter sp.]
MSKFIFWLVVVVVLALGAAFAWWWFDARWRPATVTKDQAEIVKILESSGYVSPGLGGPKAYVVVFRSCPDCIRYAAEELPKLQAAGVDTRVIAIARADVAGVQKSAAAERTTVAELWINRSWPLWEQWNAAAPEAWTAPGLHPADGDMARTAVVEAGRKAAADLKPLLAKNGVKVGEEGVKYPTLIWWTKDGEMKACACEDPRTYRFVRADLGAKN